jgi:hypothetical protein
MYPMKTESDFAPLPAEFREYRDRLRIVGHELVRYTQAHAESEAARYRHMPADYEYAIHKIDYIEDYQLYIDEHAFYSSALRVPDWTKYYSEKEKPMGFGLLKQWFSNPVTVLITLIVPPFGLTLLGMTAVEDKRDRNVQNTRRKSLGTLAEMPKFRRRHGV